MHEASLIADLLRRIIDLADLEGAERVTRVRVRLGALAHMSPDHFTSHFRDAAEGSLASGAELDIRAMTDIHDPHAQDLILESIEIE